MTVPAEERLDIVIDSPAGYRVAIVWYPHVIEPRWPSLETRVTLALGRFTGAVDRVWLDQPTLDRFLAELTELERQRSGTARLDVPGDFELSLTLANPLRSLEVAVALTQGRYVGEHFKPIGLSGGFEVSQEWLPAYLQQFRALRRQLPDR